MGWVRVECDSFAMAGCLVRAAVMENIFARRDRSGLELPAGLHFRLQREIKNVVTAIAKTCHYWHDHMWPAQQRDSRICLLVWASNRHWSRQRSRERNSRIPAVRSFAERWGFHKTGIPTFLPRTTATPDS